MQWKPERASLDAEHRSEIGPSHSPLHPNLARRFPRICMWNTYLILSEGVTAWN
jgi:hypothetical protein